MDQQNKKLKELISNYKTTFNTDTGKIVLDDLKKRSHFFNTTHIKGDSHESAFFEGQRSLVVFIESLLNQKDEHKEIYGKSDNCTRGAI